MSQPSGGTLLRRIVHEHRRVLLPLLVPAAIIWFVVKRRKARAAQEVGAPAVIA